MKDDKTFSNTGKLNFALIATYPELSKICKHIVEQEKIEYIDIFASFEKAVLVAKKIEPHVDAILSRGGTAEYIRRSVDVPVIPIPISPFDVVRSMYNIPKNIKEVAFFNYNRKIYGIRSIEKMFSKVIREYTFIDEKDIEEGVKDAKSRGIKVLIGGIIAVQLARKKGMEGIEISSGEEAVYNAVHEAIHIVNVRQRESSRAARLKVVFNSITEGIIVSDEQNDIVLYNPSAARIFKISESETLGKNVQDVLPDTRIHKVFESGKSEVACIQKIHGGIITTSHLPIFYDSKLIGVVSTFEDVTKIQNLEQQIRKKIHDNGFIARYCFKDILTNNPQMIELKEMAALYATTQSAILIEGESGTGKKLFAQSIHNASKRASGPFIAVNCAAIPENLLESELFGYEGGSFTGAKKEGKQGLFELAHNGTMFLDEIGEIPKSLQARLLRVLQEKEIMRVGGNKIVPIDIRIISATNKNLKRKVELGEFRDDLYYRLNVFYLKIPPIRERKDDISLLSTIFLHKFGVSINEKAVKEIMPYLLEYNWPGNIRELQNVIERLSLLVIHISTSSYWLELLHRDLFTPTTQADSLSIIMNVDKGLKVAISNAEKQVIDIMLERYNQDQEKVAQKLCISRTTLWRKIKGDETT